MITNIRCKYCGEKSQVTDMGNNCICPVCHKFIISISDMMREQTLEKKQEE